MIISSLVFAHLLDQSATRTIFLLDWSYVPLSASDSIIVLQLIDNSFLLSSQNSVRLLWLTFLKTLTLYDELPNSLRHKYVMFVHSLLYSLLSLCSSQYTPWKGMAYNELHSRLSCLTYSLFSLQMTTFAELAQLKVKSPTLVRAILWIISNQNLSITVNALAAAGDLFIAFVLCTMLQKSRTGFKKFVVLFSPVSLLI